jgi:hypothetical protein
MTKAERDTLRSRLDLRDRSTVMYVKNVVALLDALDDADDVIESMRVEAAAARAKGGGR